jgi:uncharacterized protein YjbJ (UPF0337 family)
MPAFLLFSGLSWSYRSFDPKEIQMAADDKVHNAANDVAGHVKEAAGKATDNPKLEAEGKADQAKGHLGQAAENVKDAFKG